MTPQRLLDGLHHIQAQTDWRSSAISKIQGDASSREYFRVFADESHFIAMLLPDPKETQNQSEEHSSKARNNTTNPFLEVASFFEKHGIRVPKIYGHAETLGVILLEDLGDNLLLKMAKNNSEEKIEKLYQKAIQELFKISILPMDSIEKNSCMQNQFDNELYQWEFLHFVECALDCELKTKISNGDRSRIIEELFFISDEFVSWNQTLVHRDYHSRNLLLLEDGKIGVIDFQDTLLGPIFYDLASLLRDSYIELPKKLQSKLIETYWLLQKEKKQHMGLSLDGFTRAFHRMGCHRNLKAAGRFFYIHQTKNNDSFLKDVPLSLKYVQQTLEEDDQLKDLQTLLSPHLTELMEKTS